MIRAWKSICPPSLGAPLHDGDAYAYARNSAKILFFPLDGHCDLPFFGRSRLRLTEGGELAVNRLSIIVDHMPESASQSCPSRGLPNL